MRLRLTNTIVRRDSPSLIKLSNHLTNSSHLLRPVINPTSKFTTKVNLTTNQNQTQPSVNHHHYLEEDGTEKREKGSWDVIVVGGGWAGIEASTAAARLGCKTVLVTKKLNSIGNFYYGPSIGGVGKSVLVKEVDALDGLIAKLTDHAGFHHRTLNRHRGPAAQGQRTLIDPNRYRRKLNQILKGYPNLTLKEATVTDLILSRDFKQVEGVSLTNGTNLMGHQVILCIGPHLNCFKRILGKVVKKNVTIPGRNLTLLNKLTELGCRTQRISYVTPPRVLKTTVNFDKLTPEAGEIPEFPFSFLNDEVPSQDYVTVRYQTQPNDLTRELFRRSEPPAPRKKLNADPPTNSPTTLRAGNRFHDTIWLEPEGLTGDIYTVQGFACSYKKDQQINLIRTISGLERVELVNLSYRFTYYTLNPEDLYPTLGSKQVKGLWSAGQVNGTLGYEESAAQGIVAGINAGLQVMGRPPYVPSPTNSYIGVLIHHLLDRLTTALPINARSCRTEFQVFLREDNADRRLTLRGHQLGCVSSERLQRYQEDLATLKGVLATLHGTCLRPSEWNRILGCQLANDGKLISAFQLLDHSHITLSQLEDHKVLPPLDTSPRARYSATVEGLYQTFTHQHTPKLQTHQLQHSQLIPTDFDYASLPDLPPSDLTLLTQLRPLTLDQVGRIPHLHPDTIHKLRIHLHALPLLDLDKPSH